MLWSNWKNFLRPYTVEEMKEKLAADERRSLLEAQVAMINAQQRVDYHTKRLAFLTKGVKK